MSKRVKAQNATIRWTRPDGKEETHNIGTWDTLLFESSDGEFAAKLDKEFMIEDYEEEAKRRGVSIERLYALIIQEALEPME